MDSFVNKDNSLNIDLIVESWDNTMSLYEYFYLDGTIVYQLRKGEDLIQFKDGHILSYLIYKLDLVFYFTNSGMSEKYRFREKRYIRKSDWKEIFGFEYEDNWK